jgi:hypothetical protein
MGDKLKNFIKSEVRKRESAQKLNRIALDNWKTKKTEIEGIFHEIFDELKIDGNQFHIDNDLNDDFSSKKYIGYDCIQVTHPMRLTGNMVITEKDNSKNYDRKKEVGAALSITCSQLGGFDVFLIPSKNDDMLIERESIIVYDTKDPNSFTRKRVLKCIRQYLIFQRVDSLFERSSLREDLYVAGLYFIDTRNRDKYRSLIFRVMNHWGAVMISALAGWIIAKST